MKKSRNETNNFLWELYQQYYKLIRKLNGLSELSSEIGDDNASLLLEMIEAFLPGKYKLAEKKKVLSRDGIQSHEIDLLIWNYYNHPSIFQNLFSSRGSRFILQDQALICIEVKTFLDSSKLEDTFLKIQKFRKKMQDITVASKRYGSNFGYHEPLYFIVAYKCSWKNLGSLLEQIKSIILKHEIRAYERFDYLYLMDKGFHAFWGIPPVLKEKFSSLWNRDNKKEVYAGVFKESLMLFDYAQYQFDDIEQIREIIHFKPQRFFPSMLISDYIALDRGVDYKIPLFGVSEEPEKSSSEIFGLMRFLKMINATLEQKKIPPSSYVIKKSFTTYSESFISTKKESF